MRVLLGSIALCVLALPSTSFAQQTDSSPVSSALKSMMQRMQRNLVGAAEEMPADKYSYKPTSGQMSFGQLVLHVAGSNDFMCATISGTKAPEHGKLEATSPKDSLVARLKESFDYCGTALGQVDDSKLGEQVPFFGGHEISRAAAMLGLAEDWGDHYSAAAVYLRLNGLLPPSAQRRRTAE